MDELKAMPKYEKYKDSRNLLLGEIPDLWEVIRLKRILRRKITDGPHETPLFIDEGVPFLSVDGIQNGDLTFDNCRFISEKDHNKYSKKCLVEKNDILMGKAASTGKVARCKVDFQFSIWSPLALIKVSNDIVSSRFVEYALKSIPSQVQIDHLCTSNTQKNISMDDIPKILICLPSRCEQTKIANFLDNKISKIDEVMAIKEKQIDLLKERKQLIIQQAVTQGLNPDASMKDSGVDWIGEIPKHWEMKKVKHIFKMIMNPAEKNNDYELISVYTEIGVKPRRELADRGNKASTTDGYWFVKKGDIVVNKLLAWMGAIGLSEYDGVTSPAYDILRPQLPVNGWFYHFMFRAPFCSSELKRHSRGIMDMRLRLYFDRFGVIEVPYPPKDEQDDIIKKLDIQLYKVDRGIDLFNEQIQKLKEYKTTLINSAVTGKIKVS